MKIEKNPCAQLDVLVFFTVERLARSVMRLYLPTVLLS